MSEEIVAKAHEIGDEERTKDVIIDSNVTFNALMLSPLVLKGLNNCGFRKPSPIQQKAIPIGRCGFDLIIKSKSGTGKTAVFTIIALELLKLNKNALQVLILTPTREIAVQITQVIKSIGSSFEGLKVETFIGGLPLEDDITRAKHCHVAVGAPGRIRHLLEENILNPKQIRLLIFDEADKLMEETFADDIDTIFNLLPVQKQVIASSATYPEDLEEFLLMYVTSPTHVTPEVDTPLLLGLRQFASIVKCNSKNVVQMMNAKTTELNRILTQVPFTQCLIFTNYQTRVESVSNTLNRQGWSTIFISSAQKQSKRLEIMDKLKNFKCRILLTTDLTSRGIDVANVDLVINYDIPYETSTYLHRMGRAGRFGTKGIVVSISAEDELAKLKHLLAEIGGPELSINLLPTNDINSNLLRCEESTFEQIKAEFQTDVQVNDGSPDIATSVIEMKQETKKKKKKKKNHKMNSRKNSENSTEEMYKENPEKSNNLLSTNTISFDIKSVNNFLNSNKMKEESIAATLENKDPALLIEGLANNTVKIDSKSMSGSSTKIYDKDEINLNHVIFEINNQSDMKEETKKRKRINEKPSNSQNILFERNVSLLHLTKLLLGKCNDNEATSEVKAHIEKLLTQIQEIEKQCELKFSNVSIDNINDFLKNHVNLDTTSSCEETIENIFRISYDYSIKPDYSLHWSTLVPKENKSKEENNDSDENQAKKYKRNNRKHVEDEYEDEGENFGEDYAQNECNEQYNEEDNDGGENYRYNEQNLETMGNECNSMLHEHYKNIYKQHKVKLMKFQQTCNSVTEFEEYFKYWKKQVKESTHYVQQNLYLDAMNNYRYYKQYE